MSRKSLLAIFGLKLGMMLGLLFIYLHNQDLEEKKHIIQHHTELKN